MFFATKCVSARWITLISVAVGVFVSNIPGYAAEGCGNGSSPDRRAYLQKGWVIKVDAAHVCRGDVKASFVASVQNPGDALPHGSADHPLGSSSVVSIPIFCRRDDYMFLPPNAMGGLPCSSVARDEHFDPYALAVRLEADLPPPDLKIGMNPALGMVAVPTWFWVEGYDGGVLSQSESVLEAHENCKLVAVRDDHGRPVLDEAGQPKVRRECTVEKTTFTVDVRLWPGRFQWDFGDRHGRTLGCPGMSDCGDALGQPFTDSRHPSPIQHPYVWSSLGINGAQDAYTIKLGISFAAQYRVTVNGNGVGTDGWRSLPERELTWTASHQVQEAQAVLTRP